MIYRPRTGAYTLFLVAAGLLVPVWWRWMCRVRWTQVALLRVTGCAAFFASAIPRFLRDGMSGLRLPDTAVYPRCSPLRTSREAGGYAYTSAPEGRGLHPHEDGVTRPCGLAACLEVLPSFQPTGRRSKVIGMVPRRVVGQAFPVPCATAGVLWA